MKNKKGLWAIVVILVIVIGLVFFLKDDRSMDDVNKEQLQSAKDSASSKLDQLEVDFDDDEMNDVEDAVLAYDTLK